MDQQSLDLLLGFMNSHDDGGTVDWFTTPELAAERIVDLGLAPVGTTLSAEESTLLLSVRDALNGLVPGSYVFEPVDVNEVAARLPLHVQLAESGSGTRLMAMQTGVEAIAAQMLAFAHEAMADGTWGRLKCCKNKEDCSFAFVDRSKNRSRVWCEMSSCGSQAKARAFRARKREARGG